MDHIDFMDMVQRVGQTDTLELLQNLGYAKQSITQAEHIYILSERGYAKLIKIMDTDLAWEIHDKLIDEYFTLRDDRQQIPKNGAPKKNLSSANMLVKVVSGIFKDAGVSPLFIAAEAKRLYMEQADIDIKIPLITDAAMPKLYDCTEIAKELGILSASGSPHKQAVSAIILKLDVLDDEKETTIFSQNGHEDVTIQYKPSVVVKIKNWLEEGGYPTKIPHVDTKGNRKTFSVIYKEKI